MKIRRKRVLKPQSRQGSIDRILASVVFALVFFGLLMVYNASLVEAHYQGYSDKYHFFKLQTAWALLGFGSVFLTLSLDCQKLKKIAPLLLFISFVLQVLSLSSLGVEAHGAQRWLKLGRVKLQPSEIIKLSLVIYLAAWLSTKLSLGGFLFVSGLLGGLVLLGKDLGTSVIIFITGVIIYFASGAPYWHFLVILPLAGLVFSLAVIFAPYRLGRIFTFINPLHDPLGVSYHIIQILLALGSGGWLGLGLGQSRQKYKFLPAASTDSIFALIGEELGFIGATGIILAYLLLISRGLQIAQRQADKFSKLLAVGITGWLGIQAFVNLGGIVALLPLTGVPLPLVSYGGSSLVISLAGVGILLNLSRQR